MAFCQGTTRAGLPCSFKARTGTAFCGHHAPRAQVNPLARLANDAQNVHTAQVNKQTADGVEMLLGVPVPLDQNTRREIRAAWKGKDVNVLRMVAKDMLHWYKQPFCRQEDDWLYKRVLDGLWAKVRVSPHKDDLLGRLWDECTESVGMCCDGHIARLCNVLVGFDDEAVAVLPIGEILQNKMAAISAKDIATHLKVGEAWLVLDELKIPMEERMNWLEAF